MEIMCDLNDCGNCKHFRSMKYPQCEFMDIEYFKEKVNRKEKLSDEEVEQIWRLLEDVDFVDNEDGDLVLANEDWFIFREGDSREYIWYWFNRNHSKGVGWLLNDFIE